MEARPEIDVAMAYIDALKTEAERLRAELAQQKALRKADSYDNRMRALEAVEHAKAREDKMAAERDGLRAEVERLKASVRKWEDHEVRKACCCEENERAAHALEVIARDGIVTILGAPNRAIAETTVEGIIAWVESYERNKGAG